MWPFQAFIEFVTILFLFYILVLFLFWPQSKWNLSFLTRDQTCTSCVGRWSVNPWTTSSVQFSRSGVSDSLRPPWTAARQASLSITNSQSSPRLMSIELVMPSNHLNLCHPLLLLPPIPPSIMVFSSESALCIRWPRDWKFSFNISPSNDPRTGDWACTSCIGRWSVNPWTTREVPIIHSLSSNFQCSPVCASQNLTSPYLNPENRTLGHIRRRQWHPTPVFLPGKSHGRRSLVGCSPWGC